MHNDQDLKRVTTNIAPIVTAFCNAHIGQQFHVSDLYGYVAANVGGWVAPGSPDRILRDLRKRGIVNYEVTNRAKSLYLAKAVQGQMELFV